MKKSFFILLALLFSMLSFTAIGGACPSPEPIFLGDDLNDPGYFQHGDAAVVFELVDLFGGIPPFFGSTFGFFFEGTQTPIVIFDPFDQAFDAAVIDFSGGKVYDVEIPDSDGNPTQQSSFSPSSANIGFFLIPTPLFPQFFTTTVHQLNLDGLDHAATYPFLDQSVPNYLLGFSVDYDYDSDGDLDEVPISLHAVTNITPVPAPLTILLLGSGLIGLAGLRKKFRKE